MAVQRLLATLIIVSMVVWVKGNHLRPKAIPPNDVIDVIQYGAIGNGVADDSQAFMEAWGAACGGTSNHPVMYIPAGKTFLLGPLNFQGPCKSPTVTVLVMGDIVAPTDIKAWTGHDLRTWIVFGNVNALTVEGNGKIDGQGGVWWPQANKLVERPSALAFENCSDLKVVGLTHVNSPGSHIHVSGCNGVTLSNLNITAPASSPNTDGIDIGQSINVHILHTNIATGDDCVAISGGSSFINISGVQCGPGHGISIGSLGDNGRTDTVEQVHVRDCTFQGTTNGVRIKTWQGGSGYARNIYFEGIKLEAVANPIIIDQYYCIRQPICKNQTSAVKVSDVYYIGVHGTSTTDVAIKLSCSKSIGCTNIQLYDIYVVSANPPAKTASFCFNAHGTSSPPTLPSVNHCLLN